MPTVQIRAQGLSILRIMLVLSSIAPLFLLWSIKGTSLLPDRYFVTGCALFAIFPTAVLFLRERIALRHRDSRPLTIGLVEDHRGHVLVYLFAILLPFYRQDVDSWREFSALLAALAFIVFLFWHLNFHYMNVLFAIRGFHVFTIHPSGQDNKYTGRDSFILITRRLNLTLGEKITALRLTNTMYLEKSS